METATPRDIAEVMRDEMIMADRIRSLLQEGPLTIPEMADRLGRPGREVVLWLMAMRRYGRVRETGRPNEEGYFQYVLAEEDPTTV